MAPVYDLQLRLNNFDKDTIILNAFDFSQSTSSLSFTQLEVNKFQIEGFASYDGGASFQKVDIEGENDKLSGIFKGATNIKFVLNDISNPDAPVLLAEVTEFVSNIPYLFSRI